MPEPITLEAMSVMMSNLPSKVDCLGDMMMELRRIQCYANFALELKGLLSIEEILSAGRLVEEAGGINEAREKAGLWVNNSDEDQEGEKI